jgi:hypothetical protein
VKSVSNEGKLDRCECGVLNWVMSRGSKSHAAGWYGGGDAEEKQQQGKRANRPTNATP